LWALNVQLIFSDNLTDLIWGDIRIHQLALQAFASVTLVGLNPGKEVLFISVDNVFRELPLAYIYELISE
jgi:hypothetical protein